jgi:hypothetical protein
MTEFIKSDFELAAELQAILINKATGEKGGAASNIDYQRIRTHFWLFRVQGDKPS